MHRFRWISAKTIPPAFDLRQGGWRLVSEEPDCSCPWLAPFKSIDSAGWVALLGIRGKELRRLILLLGVEDREERARLLKLGFGDVVGGSLGLGELEARAARIATYAQTLPRHREVGRLQLDLLQRDGLVDGQVLSLHPREFALLWRLAEQPGMPVSKSALLSDVWNMSFVPDTNSLAVHVYRLRAKLELAGCGGLVRTSASGAYYLSLPERQIAARSRYHGEFDKHPYAKRRSETDGALPA